MPHLFCLIDEGLFSQRIQPIMARCRRDRNFAAGRGLFEELLPRIRAYHASYHGLAVESLLEQALRGLSFDAAAWRAVVGEALLFAADELPLLRLSPQALCCLLADSLETPREQFAPIQQAVFGSRDLVFGGSCYRPDVAGYNDQADVVRLTGFLESVDPGRWLPADLAKMPDLPDDDEERAEELEFVRQGWPELVEMYQKASAKKQVMVCERD